MSYRSMCTFFILKMRSEKMSVYLPFLKKRLNLSTNEFLILSYFSSERNSNIKSNIQHGWAYFNKKDMASNIKLHKGICRHLYIFHRL